MGVWRVVLVVAGIAGMLWGAWLLVSTQRPDQWLSALVWLAGAIIVHDFVLVPALSYLRRRRRAPRHPSA
jgi:energy-converting hydrogenase Eha subunit G